MYDTAANPVKRLKKCGVAACRSGADREPGTADRKDFAEAAHLVTISERKTISRIRPSSLQKSKQILDNVILRQITAGNDETDFVRYATEFGQGGVAKRLDGGVGAESRGLSGVLQHLPSAQGQCGLVGLQRLHPILPGKVLDEGSDPHGLVFLDRQVGNTVPAFPNRLSELRNRLGDAANHSHAGDGNGRETRDHFSSFV